MLRPRTCLLAAALVVAAIVATVLGVYRQLHPSSCSCSVLHCVRGRLGLSDSPPSELQLGK